jgi:uncharacterized protein
MSLPPLSLAYTFGPSNIKAKDDENPPRVIGLLPALANRHGLITGATGTGKTVTLQALAEQFANIGVPVFMADVKGDLSGMALAGGGNEKVEARVKQLGITNFAPRACTVEFWDVFGEQGHPACATVLEMGPLLLSRILNLNETQSGVLTLAFKVADDNGLLLLDFKDLRALVQWVGDNAKSLTTEYGNVSAASVGAIQRGLLTLESQGGEKLFGEPALDLNDLMQTDGDGRGVINILAADKLLANPRVYATFLLWMLSELFENLPEVGDLEKPKLVFFFDEAHLLFKEAPKSLVERIEQVVRLIRSKGVGVYFVTQNPLDVPDTVLGQLGNRVQHALRAYTPRDQEAVKTAASTFRQNPDIDTIKTISELGVGEALVSFLDEKGRPSVVDRAFIAPPASRIGPLSAEERKAVRATSVLGDHYSKQIDRESAYEKLKGKAAGAEDAAKADEAKTEAAKKEASAEPTEVKEEGGFFSKVGDFIGGDDKDTKTKGRTSESVVEAAAKSLARAAASEAGRRIMRGVLGSLLGKR